MIFIILNILINTVLFIIFKLFTKFKVNTFHAIVINYCIAFTFAFSQTNANYSLVEIPKQDWFYGAIILGFLFITIFNVLASTIQKLGISVVAVASKMSVIIPILFGLVIYKETLGVYKIIGILLALVAVYLSSVKKDLNIKKSYFYLPIILFFGSGFLDALLKYFEKRYVSNNELEIYTGTIFFTAFILGSIVVIYQIIFKKLKLTKKSILAGILLGIPNYYSIFFLLKALQTKNMETSSIYTLNNVGIVLLSTLIGFLFFKEKISLKNMFGICLSIIAIILITLSI